MWFSGLVVTKAFHPPNEDHDHLLHIYINGDGALVEWRAVEVFDVEAFDGFYHGARLHSYMEWEHRTRGQR